MSVQQSVHSCDALADDDSAALCTHLPLHGPSPQGEVSCMPALLIRACQETAGFVERQVCDLL